MNSFPPTSITAEYLTILERSDKKSIWKETDLPFSKSVIKQAIVTELSDLKGVKSFRTKQLLHAYVGLALFISSDDAQLKIQAEKTIIAVREKILAGKELSEQECELLSRFEEPMVRIQREIEKEEMQLIADLAAFDCDLKIEKNPSGYRIIFPTAND